ncbi:MAG: hypothetical protein E7565_02395 [Ruminococcaceae bacterium]|nr:hypothetical protein [Oscillospiraceae bacterium]
MNREEWIKFAKAQNQRDCDLLIRSYDTLMANIYETEGYLWSPYRCISPGKRNFTGIWNWDSAFHAIGVSHFDTKLAKENIIGFLKFQRNDGLLPDVIWENGDIVDTFTKPPVFPYAVEQIYKRDKDIKFLKEVYPHLTLNERFWKEQRFYQGLFHYDADNKEAPDYITRVKYESGWDNSPRFDNEITDLWPVDLNCFMVLFYRSMAFIANELKLDDDKAKWSLREKELTELIKKYMWNKENGFFSDVNKFTKKNSEVLTPASFMPLFIEIASSEQAEDMALIAQTRFKSKMPTVTYDHPAYSTDYWRGPTWLNVAYFAAKGLKNYNCDVANQIKENILEMCDAQKEGIYENYDSLTGKGLCCDHFSWSSAFIIEFILNFNRQ